MPIGVPIPPDDTGGPAIPAGPGQPFEPDPLGDPLGKILAPEPPVRTPPKVPPPTPVPVPTPTPEPLPPLEPEPGSPEAAPDLATLALAILVLALIALAAYLTDFFNWLFRTMLGPLWSRTGSRQADPTKVTQALSNTLAKAYSGVDAHLGVSFTKLGEEASRVGKAILAAEQTVYAVVTRLSVTQQQTHGLRQANTRTQQKIATVNHAAVKAQVATATETHRATRAEHSLEGQLHALTHHVTHVLEPELDALRAKIPTLEKGATTAWDEIKKHEAALSIGALTAATATALGRLGGGWIRCEANRALGEANCGSNNDLIRKLLAGTLDVLALSDICDLAAATVAIGQELRPGLEAFVSVENALIGCHGASKPKAIRLPAVSATPVFDAVTL